MIYAQYKRDARLHLVYEPGEGHTEIVRAGFLSSPLCGQRGPEQYRMTINVPLANACQRCLIVDRARRKRQ